MMNQDKRCCIVCGSQKEQGISIWNAFICHTCEQEMVHTDVLDDKYPYFIQRMKEIWKMEA
jgi:hypothetical protein